MARNDKYHDKYKERILLSLLGELPKEEEYELDAHLAQCAECRAEHERVKSYDSMIREAGAAGPSDELLGNARRDLKRALAREVGLVGAAKSRDDRLTQNRAWSPGRSRFPFAPGAWADWFTPARAALAATVMVIAGFLAGYLVFGQGERAPHRTAAQTPSAPQANGTQANGALDRALGAPSYDNARVAGIDPRSSEVELEYDVVRSARLKGGIEDERVQRILAQSVVNADNPGARLQAINTIGAYVDTPRSDEIKQALIRAVKTDPNAGVRKQALFVLYQMPFDDDIKDACLHVLAADQNEGMRIAAVNFLAAAVLDGVLKGRDVFDAVGPRLQEEDNEFVRMQSAAFQQEVDGHGE